MNWTLELVLGKNFCHIMFADDIALVCETSEQMLMLTAVVQGWCEAFDMEINIKKSEK